MARPTTQLKDGKTVLPLTRHMDTRQFDTDATFSPIDNIDCEVFLTELRRTGIPSVAARALGRGEVCFRVLKSKNESFSDAWDWAIRESAFGLEAEARRRAVEGVERAVWYQGIEVGTEIVYSDSLLALLLKQNHPNFRDKDDEAVNPGAGQVTKVVINTVPRGKFVPKQEIDDEAAGDDNYQIEVTTGDEPEEMD